MIAAAMTMASAMACLADEANERRRCWRPRNDADSWRVRDITTVLACLQYPRRRLFMRHRRLAGVTSPVLLAGLFFMIYRLSGRHHSDFARDAQSKSASASARLWRQRNAMLMLAYGNISKHGPARRYVKVKASCIGLLRVDLTWPSVAVLKVKYGVDMPAARGGAKSAAYCFASRPRVSADRKSGRTCEAKKRGTPSALPPRRKAQQRPRMLLVTFQELACEAISSLSRHIKHHRPIAILGVRRHLKSRGCSYVSMH